MNIVNLGNKYLQIANSMKEIGSVSFYIKAALEYSSSNERYKSGLAYQLGAEVLFAHKLNYEAAINYIKAAKQYDNIDNNKSIITLTLAINLLIITRRFEMVATSYKILGLLNIKEKRFLEAIDAYDKASKNYKKLGMNKEELTCKHKMCTIMIQNEDYEKALVNLEKIEPKNKEIFFDIGILRLYINNTSACTKFLVKQDQFMLTKEYFLLNDLIIALDLNNNKKFSKLLIDYNFVFPFEKWQFSILINILERI